MDVTALTSRAVDGLFFAALLCTKRQISPRMNTYDTDCKLKMVLLNFLIRVNQCCLW